MPRAATPPSKRAKAPWDTHPSRHRPPNSEFKSLEDNEIKCELQDLYQPFLDASDIVGMNNMERQAEKDARAWDERQGLMPFHLAAIHRHITSCFIVARRADKILMLAHQETRKDAHGKLGFPGGKARDWPELLNETLWEAACREFVEESEYDGALIPWAVRFVVHPGSAKKTISIYFCDFVEEQDSWTGPNSEIVERLWIPQDEYIQGVDDRSLLRQMRRFVAADLGRAVRDALVSYPPWSKSQEDSVDDTKSVGRRSARLMMKSTVKAI